MSIAAEIIICIMLFAIAAGVEDIAKSLKQKQPPEG